MPIEPLHWDSFHVPAAVADLLGDYSTSGPHALETVDGLRCVRQGPSSLSRIRLTRELDSMPVHLVTGARTRFSSTTLWRYGWYSGNTPRLELAYEGANVIGLYVGGTKVAESPAIAQTSSWQYIEIDAHRAASGWVDIYLGREKVIEWVGDSTVLADVTNVQSGRSGSGSSANEHWTDLYVAQVTGADEGQHGNVLGPIKAPDLPPNADVTTAWTRSSGTDTHPLLATQPRDGDANYVESGTADDEDVLGVDGSSLDPDAPILAVGVYSVARQPAPGTLELRHGITSGAETVYSDPFVVLDAYRGRLRGHWLVDPADSEPWDKTRVDALNLRYQNRAGS
jgi:hypothetical protein